GPLVAIAAFLVVGLVLGERFSYFPVLVLASLAAGLFLWRRAGVSSVSPGLVFLPLVCGLLYYQIAVRHPAQSDLFPYLDGDLVTFEGRLEDPVRHYPDRMVGILAVDKLLL